MFRKLKMKFLIKATLKYSVCNCNAAKLQRDCFVSMCNIFFLYMYIKCLITQVYIVESTVAVKEGSFFLHVREPSQ